MMIHSSLFLKDFFLNHHLSKELKKKLQSRGIRARLPTEENLVTKWSVSSKFIFSLIEKGEGLGMEMSRNLNEFVCLS
jgi:hypothetical protein